MNQFDQSLDNVRAILKKKKALAPRVLHLLEQALLESKDLVVNNDDLPTSTNKFRLLSIGNMQYIVKKLSEDDGLAQHKLAPFFNS